MVNTLLTRLPSESAEVIAPYLRPVALARGAEWDDNAGCAPLVTFPTSAVVAIEHEVEPGQATVVGLIDCHGMTGMRAVLGHGGGSMRLRVVVPGDALQLETGHLMAEFARSAAVRQRVLGWVQVVLTQATLAASCLRFHPVVERMCLRLSQLAAGGGDDELRITQHQLGDLVGARREATNQVLARLRERGWIEHERGHIRLRDRDAVARTACGCWGQWHEALRRAGLDRGAAARGARP